MELVRQAFRLVRGVSPPLGARLNWLRLQRAGDTATRVVDTLVRPGAVAVDIGANWGLYAWRLAQLVGPGGHVYAFEPDPTAAKSVRQISRGRQNLTFYRMALSDHAGEATLHIPVYRGERISALASLAPAGPHSGLTEQSVTVKMQPLDAVLPPAGPPVRFIKCDVEGHELAVLRGAEAILRRSQPSLLVEIEQRNQHGGARVDETFHYLAGLGYAGYALRDDGIVPLAQFDLQRDQLAYVSEEFVPHEMPHGYVNDFLFVQPASDVRRLLAQR